MKKTALQKYNNTHAYTRIDIYTLINIKNIFIHHLPELITLRHMPNRRKEFQKSFIPFIATLLFIYVCRLIQSSEWKSKNENVYFLSHYILYHHSWYFVKCQFQRTVIYLPVKNPRLHTKEWWNSSIILNSIKAIRIICQ